MYNRSPKKETLMFGAFVSILRENNKTADFCNGIEGVDLSAIPDDIFISIFSALDIEAQNAFGNTCQRFRAIADSEIVWENNLTRYFPNAPDERPNLTNKEFFFQLVPLKILHSEHMEITDFDNGFSSAATSQFSFSKSLMTRAEIAKELPERIKKVKEEFVIDEGNSVFLCFSDRSLVPGMRTHGQKTDTYKLWVKYHVPKT